ncbi:hypothetical protein BC938DRAFT_473679 [Jimgerdemannia flammicorona]|uniref:Uncharacterized protein n=1 Tax=Jimgerdemannia flammicorona TaxID=994334 RepID=A0A433Q3Q2_9FUNG|nr:hypothetical protein BC938DRAFT_473679 [Jimgerdemannia flammicorona]
MWIFRRYSSLKHFPPSSFSANNYNYDTFHYPDAFQSRNIPTYLLGLKSDQTEARKVEPDDGLKLGNEFGVRHIEMNAMTVDGVQRMKEIFAKLARKCSRKRGERRRSSVIDSETNPVVTYPAPEVPEKTVEVAVESRVLEAESRVMDNLDEHTEDDDEEDKGQYKLPKFGNDAFGAKETLFDVFTTHSTSPHTLQAPPSSSLTLINFHTVAHRAITIAVTTATNQAPVRSIKQENGA